MADALSARSGGHDEQGMHGMRAYGAMDELTSAESAWQEHADDVAAMEEAELTEARHTYERFQAACEAELAAERSARTTLLTWTGMAVLLLMAVGFVYIQRQGGTSWPGSVRDRSATGSTVNQGAPADVEELIRRAVSEAARTNAPGMVRVNIPSGTFTLRQPLELAGSVHLRGAGPEATIIRSAHAGHMVLIDEGSHRIEGLTLSYTGSAPAHGVLVTCCRLELANAVVEGATEGPSHLGVGVNIRGDTQALIESSTIRSNGFGIAVTDRANATVRDNLIISNRGRGLSMHNSATGTITNNTISDNGYGSDGADFWQGIALQNDARPTIEGNEIRGNAGVGIQFWNASGGVVRDNRLIDNGSNIAAYAPPNASAAGIAVGVSGRATDHQPSPTISANNTFSGNFGGTVRDYR
jgi:parallel beta-helix repeat protein